MMEMISPKEGEHILDAGCGSVNLSFEMGKDPIICISGLMDLSTKRWPNPVN